jgi:hypothetical protein
MSEDVREDFGVILSATLTLLGLLIGFNAETARLQSELWSALRAPAASQATPVAQSLHAT